MKSGCRQHHQQRESSRSPKKRDALRDSLRDSLRAGVLRPVDPMAKVEAELARLRSDLAAMASRVEDLGGLVAAAAGRPRPSGGPGAAAPSPEEERLRSFRTSEAAVESALVSFEPAVLEDLRRRESVAEAPPEPEPGGACTTPSAPTMARRPCGRTWSRRCSRPRARRPSPRA